MAENFDYHGEAEELLKKAIRSFAAWAATNWTMRVGEADTLTDPSPSPREYERGYNDAVSGIGDAASCWLEDGFNG